MKGRRNYEEKRAKNPKQSNSRLEWISGRGSGNPLQLDSILEKVTHRRIIWRSGPGILKQVTARWSESCGE